MQNPTDDSDAPFDLREEISRILIDSESTYSGNFT